jgi:hypothetical protein
VRMIDTGRTSLALVCGEGSFCRGDDSRRVLPD